MPAFLNYFSLQIKNTFELMDIYFTLNRVCSVFSWLFEVFFKDMQLKQHNG